MRPASLQQKGLMSTSIYAVCLAVLCVTAASLHVREVRDRDRDPEPGGTFALGEVVSLDSEQLNELTTRAQAQQARIEDLETRAEKKLSTLHKLSIRVQHHQNDAAKRGRLLAHELHDLKLRFSQAMKTSDAYDKLQQTLQDEEQRVLQDQFRLHSYNSYLDHMTNPVFVVHGKSFNTFDLTAVDGASGSFHQPVKGTKTPVASVQDFSGPLTSGRYFCQIKNASSSTSQTLLFSMHEDFTITGTLKQPGDKRTAGNVAQLAGTWAQDGHMIFTLLRDEVQFSYDGAVSPDTGLLAGKEYSQHNQGGKSYQCRVRRLVVKGDHSALRDLPSPPETGRNPAYALERGFYLVPEGSYTNPKSGKTHSSPVIVFNFHSIGTVVGKGTFTSKGNESSVIRMAGVYEGDRIAWVQILHGVPVKFDGLLTSGAKLQGKYSYGIGGVGEFRYKLEHFIPHRSLLTRVPLPPSSISKGLSNSDSLKDVAQALQSIEELEREKH